ncbi:MAG: IPTL-CTERM sorting domain-containing protein [Burkholderiales bacterium]|nr:IPTL-CTERM sorting domain-containing protein [Burkholderiales bacterium]
MNILSKLLAAATLVVATATGAQTVSGSFSQSPVGPNTASTLTLNYAGFTPQSSGAVFRFYYRASDFTGTPAFTSTASDYQGSGAPTAGTLAGCANADTYFTMNWVNFGNAWPSAASGTLGSVAVTTSAGFAANAVVCVQDDAGSPVARAGVNTSYTLAYAEPSPSVTIGAFTDNTCTTASPALTDSAAQVATICVTSSLTRVNPLTVNLTPAAASGRYSTTCGATIQIAAGQSRATCTVTATANTTAFDGSATATTALATGTGYTLGATTSAAVTINNDDLPTVNVTPGAVNQPDNGGSTTVTVTISTAAPTGGFTVPLATSISNAARASSTCGPSITIAAGQTSNTCTVTGTANTIANDGTATVTVASACVGTCTNGTSSVVTITDDDIPVITVSCTAATLTDSAGQQSICRATTDKALSAAGLTINVTAPAANARYSLSNCAATAAFAANAAANSTVNICTIDAVANTALGDGNATATVAVASGAGYSLGSPASANVVVQNDDLASISVASAPASVAENSGTPIVFTFTASAASPNATNILFTPPVANATRYTTDCVSPIVLPANATTVTCSVTPVNTTAVDGNVTASVTVLASAGNYTIGTAAASGTITDDEVGVSVVGTGAVEGSNVSFNITCTGPASSTATVTFAISGQDAGATITPAQGPVTVTCGTPTTVTVSTVNDATIGNNRSVSITLSNPVAPAVLVTSTASAAVADNDQPTQIPTLGTLGLGLMSLMLAGLAAFQRRRLSK